MSNRVEAEASAASPLSVGQWRWLMALVAVAGIVWILVSRVPPDAAQRDGATVAPMTGFLAPDFALTTLEGERVQQSALRGSPVIVNFWATWCPPCRAEMPELEAVWRQYKDAGLVLLGVDQAESANGRRTDRLVCWAIYHRRRLRNADRAAMRRRALGNDSSSGADLRRGTASGQPGFSLALPGDCAARRNLLAGGCLARTRNAVVGCISR